MAVIWDSQDYYTYIYVFKCNSWQYFYFFFQINNVYMIKRIGFTQDDVIYGILSGLQTISSYSYCVQWWYLRKAYKTITQKMHTA